MFNILFKTFSTVATLGLAGYFLYLFGSSIIEGISVTWVNIIMTIISLPLMAGLMVVGTMAATAPGRKGFGSSLLVFLALSYPAVFFIGLIASISMLYSDYEAKETIAMWLASMSVIHLLVLVALFASLLAIESIKKD